MASSKSCTCGRQRGKPFRPLSADVGARGPQVTKRLPFSCLPAGCDTTAALQPRNLCLAFVVNEGRRLSFYGKQSLIPKVDILPQSITKHYENADA